MADAKSEELAQQQGETIEAGDFAALLEKEFKPKSDRAKEEVQSAVHTLAEQVLQGEALLADDVVGTINAIIAEIDAKLTEQVNQIMHNEDFQKLEGAWRGLHHLVNNTETDEMLKIRVMNISKKDLHKTLKKFKGTAWDQSPLFKKLYEEEYGTPGGEPYGCLIGDYEFEHTPPDVEILQITQETEDAQVARLKKLKADRDQARHQAALDRLREEAKNGANVMPALIDAAKADATVGEMIRAEGSLQQLRIGEQIVSRIDLDAPIANETGASNTRGTIAMLPD